MTATFHTSGNQGQTSERLVGFWYSGFYWWRRPLTVGSARGSTD